MLKTFLQQNAVVPCKKGSKKQLIFEKWELFETFQKWPPSKGYSVCKIPTLGEKLKMQKKHTKNVSITHCASKNGSQSKNETILKIAKTWPPSKGYNLGKFLTLGQKWKIQIKTFLQHIALVLWKNCSQKQQIFEKWKLFKNWQK